MSVRNFSWGIVFLVITRLAASGAETASAPVPGDLRAAGKIEFPITSGADIRPEF